MTTRHTGLGLVLGLAAAAACWPALAQDLKPVEVEGQPLAANATRLLQALDFLGSPLAADRPPPWKPRPRTATPRRFRNCSTRTCSCRSPSIPSRASRSSAARRRPTLQQGGYVPILVKVVNDSTVKKPLQHHQSRRPAPSTSGGDRPQGQPARTASSTSRCSRSRR